MLFETMSRSLFYLLFFLTTSGAALVVFFGIRAVTPLRRCTQWILFGGALLGYSVLLVFQPPGWFISDVAVLAVAILFGATIGRTIGSRHAVMVFVVVAAAIDVLSFSGGMHFPSSPSPYSPTCGSGRPSHGILLDVGTL